SPRGVAPSLSPATSVRRSSPRRLTATSSLLPSATVPACSDRSSLRGWRAMALRAARRTQQFVTPPAITWNWSENGVGGLHGERLERDAVAELFELAGESADEVV